MCVLSISTSRTMEALQAENDSLKIRLAAAHDKIALLQQALEGEMYMRRAAEELMQANTVLIDALKASLQEKTEAIAILQEVRDMAVRNHHTLAHDVTMLKRELMRRGADNPDAQKPPQETVFIPIT